MFEHESIKRHRVRERGPFHRGNAYAITAGAQTHKGGSLHLTLAIALAFVYYALLITNGSLDLFHPPETGLVSGVVFNSMLSHLLRGDFAVDPEAIRMEAFVQDGKPYAYFGIALALLRLPLLPFDNFATLNVTALSMVIATCVAAYFKCASLLLIKRLGNENSTLSALYGLLILWILVGPQVQFLKASIYQEVICWAMALCSAFIYCAIRGLLLPSRFSASVLIAMASLAGVALLTRVTAGIALYGALLLLLASLASREWPAVLHGVGRESLRRGGDGPSIRQWLMSRRVMAPLLILSGFAVVCGAVNYARWGNPFEFADVHLNRLMIESGRIAVVDEHGAFNLLRLPFSLLYYFLPIGFLRTPDGTFLFADFRARYFDGVELPPSSLLITDAATVILAVTFFAILIRKRSVPGLDLRHAGAVLAGFTLPVVLILSYYFLAFRYRGEFYPLFDFAVILGFYAVTRTSDGAMPPTKWRYEKAVGASVIVGIFASHLALGAYKVSPFQSENFVADGWAKNYSLVLTEWRTTLRDIW